MMLKTFGLHCIFVLKVNAMRAFSATPFSRVFVVTLIFVFWPSKVVETIRNSLYEIVFRYTKNQNVPNSHNHINIQRINQHLP